MKIKNMNQILRVNFKILLLFFITYFLNVINIQVNAEKTNINI